MKEGKREAIKFSPMKGCSNKQGSHVASQDSREETAIAERGMQGTLQVSRSTKTRGTTLPRQGRSVEGPSKVLHQKEKLETGGGHPPPSPR